MTQKNIYKSSGIISKIGENEIVFVDDCGEEVEMNLFYARLNCFKQCCKSEGMAVYVCHRGYFVLAFIGCVKHLNIPYEVWKLTNLKPLAVIPISVSTSHMETCFICRRTGPNKFCKECAERIENEFQEKKLYWIFK